MMKRWSVRLAAVAAVILLGLLAVGQAHRDRQLSSQADWDLNAEFDEEQPQAPLAAEDESSPWPAPPDTEIYRGNDRGDASAAASRGSTYGDIALTSHEEASETAPQAVPEPAPMSPPPTSFAMPDSPAGASDSAASLQSPAALEVPDNAQPVRDAEMPPLQLDQGPAFSMNFTGLEEQEEAAPAPAEASAPVDVAATSESADSAASQMEQPQEATQSTADQLSTHNTLRSLQAEASVENVDPAAAYQFQPAEVATLPSPESAAVPTPPATPSPAPADFSAQGAEPAPANMAGTGAETNNANPGGYGLPDNPPSLAVENQNNFAGSAADAASSSGGAEGSLTRGQSAAAAPQASQPAGASQGYHPAAEAPMARVASREPARLPPRESVLAAPGDRRLDGAQAPSVIIHKRAPEEVHVGKPATFVIQVQNVGTTEALNVRIFDRVPQGMRLVDATPSPDRQENLLSWALGAIEPGGERSLTMQLIPEQEGELGSVARVTFEAAASVRTISTRPELRITQRAPEQVMIGQQLEIEILIENVGSGSASNVVLQEDVPEGLEHPKGRQLDNLIGTLAPGETRSQTLRLRATGAGTISNLVELVAEDGLTAKHSVDVEVVAPKLVVDLQGPSLRYLERQATYNVSVANQGTATASDVEVVAYLDRGFTFVSTEFEGQYDPARHAVYWSLAELPAGQQGLVPLTLLPVEEGEQGVRLEAAANLGVQAESEKRVTVDTLAELTFAVADDQDPIETSSETTYEIRVTNAGTRDDTNVQLRIELPPGLELQSADRKAGTDNNGMIVFEPLERIAPQQEELFRIRVRGRQPGTHVIKAVLSSDQASVPVTKEESTRVYSDQ